MNAAISLRDAVFRVAPPALKAQFMNKPFSAWPAILESLDASANSELLGCLNACVQLASAKTALAEDTAGRNALSSARACNIALASYERSNVSAAMALTASIVTCLRPTTDGFITHTPTNSHYSTETLAANMTEWGDESHSAPVFAVDF